MDEFRALCAELVDELADFQLAVIEAGVGWACPNTEALIDRVRAALAEPEPKVAEPTYSEVLAIRDELDANGYGTVDLVAFARAVLARYGHQPAPPAAGKVRKLVAALRCEAVAAEGDPLWMSPSELRRAADLLEQRHPEPVPVSERLPGPDDCDAEGRCWWFAAETEVDFGAWTFGTSEACTGDNWGHTHWLPATVLPLPTSEAQP